MIVDRATLQFEPRFEAGTYTAWIGFFAGAPPNWKNLPLSDAPQALRDEHVRLRLTTVELVEAGYGAGVGPP